MASQLVARSADGSAAQLGHVGRWLTSADDVCATETAAVDITEGSAPLHLCFPRDCALCLSRFCHHTLVILTPTHS